MKRIAIITALTALSVAALAETFSGNILVRPQWTHQKVGATTASESFGTLYNWTFTSGTNANQMNQLWVSQRTLTNGATETINIAGAITNSFGTVLTVSELRLLVVSSAVANVDTITVGGAAANALAGWVADPTDKITIRPGGFFLMAGPDSAGYAVSTNGSIKVANNGTNSVIYDIYIGGSSE